MKTRTETFSITDKVTGKVTTWTQEVPVPTLEETIQRAFDRGAISEDDRDRALAEVAELRSKGYW